MMQHSIPLQLLLVVVELFFTSLTAATDTAHSKRIEEPLKKEPNDK
jgi:hypothetical protein